MLRYTVADGIVQLLARPDQMNREGDTRMTRKDYVLISDVLRDALDSIIDDMALEALASSFADELTLDNPRFDRARFLAACGVK